MRVRGMALSFVIVLCMAASLLEAASVPVVATIPEIEAGITVIEDDVAGGGFGWCIEPLGDINADGRDDVAFLAEGWVTMPPRVSYVLLGRETLPPRLELSRWEEWGVRFRETEGGSFYWPFVGVGDVDGDGVNDMTLGVNLPVEPPLGYILLGGQDMPRDVTTDDLASLPGCAVYPDATLQVELPDVGFTAFAAGDVDGDGLRDLAYGLSYHNRPGYYNAEGVVYVVRGVRPFPSSIDLTEVGTTVSGTRITATCARGPIKGVAPMLGDRMAGGKDFDGDGFQDLVIAAPQWPIQTAEEERAGAIFVVFGRSEWPSALDIGAVGAPGVCRMFSRWSYASLGSATLAAIDDVTGDGAPDLLVSGAPNSDEALYAGESCYLISGADLVPGDFMIGDIATTFFPFGTDRGTAGAGLGDWDGDGMGDLAFGIRDASWSSGIVCVVTGRTAYPSPCWIDDPLDGLLRIVGHAPHARLGACMAGADLTGDGRPELIAGSAGGSYFALPLLPPDPNAPPGRLYVIPRGLDFLGPLEAHSFSPTASDLAGGGTLTAFGRGFDVETALALGDTPLEILERPDSKTIVARIPQAASEASLPVKVTRRADSAVFPDEFTYFESVFPPELDVKDLGERGMVLLDSQFYPRDANHRDFVDYVRGSGDFTGDGKADVLCALETHGTNDCTSKFPGKVFLIHGMETFPQTLTTNALASYATILTSGNPEDKFGENAELVGDMNGDGLTELAIAAPLAGRIYVLFGGDISKGELNVETLIGAGGGFVIEDCPIAYHYQFHCAMPGVQIASVGDVNGDGLRDFGLRSDPSPTREGVPEFTSALAFVLGRTPFPPAIPYESLPRIEPPRAPWENAYNCVYVVNGVGDVDGDGFDDVYVWCYWSSDSSYQYRRFIFFGRPNLESLTSLDNEPASGGAVEFLYWPANWGAGVGGIGDQNGDGKDDIGVRCSFDADGGGSTSVPARFWLRVLYGRSRQELAARRDISKESQFDVTFPQADDSVQRLMLTDWGRDVNADGRPDILLLQGRHYDRGLPDRATVLFGGDLESKAGVLSEVRDAYRLVDYSPWVGSGLYGISFESYHFAGDVNGDGYEDTLVRTPGTLWLYLNPLGAIKFGRMFVRGDANQDGTIDIADAITTLQFLFAHGRVLSCMDAGDANDDEQVNIADAISVLSFLFGSGVKPPLPPPNVCGGDPSGETLDCRESLCR